MSAPALKLDWASHAAAVYAVRHWHYSRSLPAGKTVKVGVWEAGRYIGAVIFARGASHALGRRYGLKQTELCELARVALSAHVTPISRIVRIAILMLRQQSPGMRLIISFADPRRGHHGGIYQAGNWIYTGTSEAYNYRINGKLEHPRQVCSIYPSAKLSWLRANIDPHAERVHVLAKHRYLMPLDEAMRVQVECLRQPYPRPKQALTGTPPEQRRGSTDPDAPHLSDIHGTAHS